MNEDGATRAYRLLGFLQKEYAPTSKEVEALTTLYNDMRADNMTEEFIEVTLFEVMHDGLQFGNWFWNG